MMKLLSKQGLILSLVLVVTVAAGLITTVVQTGFFPGGTVGDGMRVQTNQVELVIPVTGCDAQRKVDLEKKVLELVNQERSKKKLAVLKLNDKLETAAWLHSADMGCNGFFGHQSPDGSSFDKRIKRQEYTFDAAGEVIYAGAEFHNSPEEAVKAWMASASHRKNLLKGDYSEIGVGVIYAPDSTYGGYYTVVMAHPSVP